MKSMYIKIFLLFFFTGMSAGCTRFVTVDPPSTQLISSTVFTNDVTATAAMIGIYSNMMNANLGFFGGALTMYGALSADEFQNYSFSTDQSEFAANSLKPTNLTIKQLWGEPYQYIYAANSILSGLSNAGGVSPAVSAELQGEAKFIRALSYFYLVNLYGDIPLVLQTAYAINDTMKRTSSNEVYLQIVRDLQDAQNLLPADYSGTGERIRPNQSAAAALLARVLLYRNNWAGAIAQATTVIDNVALFNLEPDLNTVFLSGSREAIWQLQPVVPQMNTWESFYFILSGGPNSSPAEIALTDSLVQGFEPGDLRKANWISLDSIGGQNSYYPFKYKVKTGATPVEYFIVLRFAEQYLIRAEAEARLGKTTESISDLNFIRERAGLPDLSSSLTMTQCLDAVYQERRVELFAEWGHRWFDLKRTSQATTVLSIVKSGWQATDTLYPVPQSEIQNDPKLSQNPGY